MTKAEIRRQIAARRPDFQTLEKWSAAAVEKFQTLEVFKSARTVGAYMPMADEVDITPLFSFDSFVAQDRQSSEKVFYIPAFDESLGSYRLARYDGKLRKGKFGIPEPVNPVFAAADEIDLIVVPGVAFDRAGRRVGRGGGFYDRLLPLYSAVRAGICFDFQCLENVPGEEHDAVMDYLITDRHILKFAMNS